MLLLLLKTSSRKKTSKRHSGKRHSGKRHSGKRHSGKRHSGKRHSGKSHKRPIQQEQPIQVIQKPQLPYPNIPPAPRFAFHMPSKRKSSKRNLKGDIEKVLLKVRKVQNNKQVIKHKAKLDKCMKDASCDINNKTCVKTYCNKELKKYTKRFNKEYKKIE